MNRDLIERLRAKAVVDGPLGRRHADHAELMLEAAAALEAEASEGDRAWRLDVDAAPRDRVIEVVGRTRTASAGFPQYAEWWDSEACWKSVSYSHDGLRPLVVWAWRERTYWPREPERSNAV